MQILTIDIGTGTQDIYLYDSRLDLENGFKLVAPSPTMLVHHQIKACTRRGEPLLLTGSIMGGGPSQWAAEAHRKAGFPVYITPQAALSFNDDLEKVRAMNFKLISEEEASALSRRCTRIELQDFNFSAISRACAELGISLDNLDAVAVAVFDHGNAPPDISDRQFRFDYLNERIQSSRGPNYSLSNFAFPTTAVPASMTRLQSIVHSARRDPLFPPALPLVVMDTAPAAVLGALFDPQLKAQQELLVANIGNFHTLAFRLGAGGIQGVFEHHTGLLDQARLEHLLRSLADGSLRHADVFEDHGHGALVYTSQPYDLTQGEFGVSVTGPRRSMLKSSSLRPYFPAPFGDMMIAGCFGLLAATADVLPELSETIRQSLAGAGGSGTPPWDA